MNLISKYMNYKLNRLKNYTTIFFDFNDSISGVCISKFFETYIMTYYYHYLGTLTDDLVIEYDYSIIKKELDGIELELIHEDKIDESIVKKCKKCALFFIDIDKEVFSSKLEISDFIDNLILQYKYIIDKNKLIKFVKEDFNLNNKFFKDDNKELFYLNYNHFKEHDNLYKVSLKYDIKLLTNCYKTVLVNKVYNSDDVFFEKLIVIINKLSMDILYNRINGKKIDYYFIECWDLVFFKEKNIKTIFSLLDNIVLRRHIIITISNNTYLNNKVIFDKYKDKYKFACIQDFSHINDVENKISVIDKMNVYKYIVVSGYKLKDEDNIFNYEKIYIDDILVGEDV